MNTDWIAYLITAGAAIALIAMFLRNRKKGGCCKNSCSALKPKEDEKHPKQ